MLANQKGSILSPANEFEEPKFDAGFEESMIDNDKESPGEDE